MLTEQDVLNRLREACNAVGGQAAYAKLHDVSAAYVNDVLHGRRQLAGKILEALGLERISMFRAVGSAVGSHQNEPTKIGRN